MRIATYIAAARILVKKARAAQDLMFVDVYYKRANRLYVRSDERKAAK